MRATMVEWDTLPVLRVTLQYRNGTPVNLDGATVTLRFGVDEGSVFERQMLIDDASAGIGHYTFQSNEITPGTMSYEVLTVFADGGRLTTIEPKTLLVRARL
jgi:hypothetical protein